MLKREEVGESPFFRAAYYNLLAIGAYQRAMFDEAQDWCWKGIELREQYNYSVHLATSYTFFADILVAIHEYDKALVYLRKALKIFTKEADPHFLSGIYCSIGNLFYQTDELDSSTFFHQQALTIYQEENDFKGLAVAYTNLANIKYDLDFLVEAIVDYKLARVYYLKSGDEAGSAVPLINIAASFEYLDAPDSAIFYYQKALCSMRLGGNNRFEDVILTGLADSYDALGLKDSALAKLRQYIAYSDSVFATAQHQSILEADAKYRTKEKDQQLLLQQEKSNKLSAEAASKRKTIYILLALFAFVALGVLYYYRNFRQKIRLSNLEMAVKNQEINTLLKDQEAKSYAALLEGQSTERERIAQDLHDQLGGTLAAVKVHFSLMDQKITELKTDNRELFNKVNDMLGDAVQEVRRISHDLASGRLSKLGLRGALNDLMEILSSAKKLQVDFFMDERLPQFDPKKEQEIYAIVQEMVSNTLKHANATQVELQLNKQGNTCIIMFEDNGAGFNYEQSKIKGLGLTGLANRIERMNGKLTIDSLVGRGTISIIELPL